MNFNDYINNFRIEAVKISLSNGEHKKSARNCFDWALIFESYI
jgi:hypothetical protein